MYLKLLIFILVVSTNAMNSCIKNNGVYDDYGNCDCTPFLTNLEAILQDNQPDYTEYCYKDDPLVVLFLLWKYRIFKKDNVVNLSKKSDTV